MKDSKSYDSTYSYVMSQTRHAPQTLPRISGAASHKGETTPTRNTADAKAAAPITSEWTSTAALRRIYAPSPPERTPEKPGKWHGRSLAPLSPPRAELQEPSRGFGHHLAPLQARDSAQQRYNRDAVRFMLAMEESQRTAIKFGEHRYRLYVLKQSLAQQRLLEASTPTPTLYAEDGEAPRAVTLSANEGAASSKPSPVELCPQREFMAGELEELGLQGQCKVRNSQLSEAVPQLTAEEVMLPSLKAEEACSPESDGELRRLRRVLATSLVDDWWLGFEAAAATAPREPGVAEGDTPSLRATSENRPHMPLKRKPTQHRSSADVNLRRVREVTAADYVDEILDSLQVSPSAHPLCSSEVQLPCLTAHISEAAHPSSHATRQDAEDDVLRYLRQREAAVLVDDAFMRRRSTAEARSTKRDETETSRSSVALPVLQSSKTELPRCFFAAEVQETQPRDNAHGNEKSAKDIDAEEVDGLRQARLMEARTLVDDVLRRPLSRLTNQEHLRASEDEAPCLCAVASQAASAVPPPSGLHSGQKEASPAAPLYASEIEEANEVLQETDTFVRHELQGRKHMPLAQHQETHQHLLQPQQHNLRQARRQMAEDLVGSLSFARTEVLYPGASEERLHSSAALSSSYNVQRARQQQDQHSGDLYAARRALAQHVVHDVFSTEQTCKPHTSTHALDVPLSLRDARLREAAVLLGTVM